MAKTTNATKPAAKPAAQPGTSPKGNTVRLHRVLRAPPEKVYKAFLDAKALVKWMAPHGYTAQVHHIDPKVGGTYRMSFTNFGNGQTHAFGGTYTELKPGERLRYTDKFEDPNMPGEMHMTVELKKNLLGTDLSIVQEGVPPQIPLEFCYAGWQESLTLLAHVVEPDIPAQP
jgi:uncharacterized protein YndB with AHSA1/START domain